MASSDKETVPPPPLESKSVVAQLQDWGCKCSTFLAAFGSLERLLARYLLLNLLLLHSLLRYRSWWSPSRIFPPISPARFFIFGSITLFFLNFYRHAPFLSFCLTRHRLFRLQRCFEIGQASAPFPFIFSRSEPDLQRPHDGHWMHVLGSLAELAARAIAGPSTSSA